MYFYFIIALQAYCIYHLIKSRNQYYWIFLIIFLPLIGCVIYLLTQVYNKQEAEKVSHEFVAMVNPTKKIKDLEKQLAFTDTFLNKLNLADAYLENKDYSNAIKQYESALNKDYENDFYLLKGLITSYYHIESYNDVVNYAERIKKHPEFSKSELQFYYGVALEKLGREEEAEKQLRAIDVRYSNYDERLYLAKFLISKNKIEEGKELLNELGVESQHMTKRNKEIYKTTIAEAAKLLESYK